MITVFTPTFNRGYIIETLYRSLCRQTNKDFEWLVVDDGSTDNTQELIQSFVKEALIEIRYIKQPNGGKHRALNRGVKAAIGELFFIVDSDDYLADNALEQIAKHYDDIRDDASFDGVCGIRDFFSGKRIGGDCDFGILDCSSLDFRYKYHYKGDMAEVFKTEILRQYPFPEIEGEKFCPESLVWNRIASKYRLRYFYEKIYFCEYREDGLSASVSKIYRNSPQAMMLYYSETFDTHSLPRKIQMKSIYCFWKFARLKYLKKISVRHKWKFIFFSILGYPLGRALWVKDVLKERF